MIEKILKQRGWVKSPTFEGTYYFDNKQNKGHIMAENINSEDYKQSLYLDFLSKGSITESIELLQDILKEMGE